MSLILWPSSSTCRRPFRKCKALHENSTAVPASSSSSWSKMFVGSPIIVCHYHMDYDYLKRTLKKVPRLHEKPSTRQAGGSLLPKQWRLQRKPLSTFSSFCANRNDGKHFCVSFFLKKSFRCWHWCENRICLCKYIVPFYAACAWVMSKYIVAANRDFNEHGIIWFTKPLASRMTGPFCYFVFIVFYNDVDGDWRPLENEFWLQTYI